MQIRAAPSSVEPYEVPIVTPYARRILSKSPPQKWCPAVRQLLPYIDGKQTVLSIAGQADMELSIVYACLQNLVYYNVVHLLPAFLYSNIYTVTTEVDRLLSDLLLQKECLDYVAHGHRVPLLRDVLRFYCDMKAGTSVRVLCLRHSPHKLGIDERKLVQFGILNSFIRRLMRYPVRLQGRTGPYNLGHRIMSQSMVAMFNGRHCYDEICCRFTISPQELDDKIENDSNILILWK